MDRNMRDAAENARQEFRNPIFDTALRDEKNEKQRKQYEAIKKTEFEIKELKQQKEQLEKDMERNQETKTYYESQGSGTTPTAVEHAVSKAEKELDNIRTIIERKGIELDRLKKEQLEDY
jgi:hypothetical protein